MIRTEDVAKKNTKRFKLMAVTQCSKEIACIIHDMDYLAWNPTEEYLLRYIRKHDVLGESRVDDLRAELNSEHHGASKDYLTKWRDQIAPADQ